MAIHFQPQVECVRIRHFVGGYQPRSERTESVAALALVPCAAQFELVFALGYVVDDAIAGDMLERIGFIDIAPAGADHHA